MESSIYVKTYCIRILVYTERGPLRKLVEEIKWLNMPFEVFRKWKWYFKYREALLIVKYPRHYIQVDEWKMKPSGMTAIEMERNRIKREMATCRRMITKISNLIEQYKYEQSALLIQDFENENYLKMISKVSEYKLKLKTLEKECKNV